MDLLGGVFIIVVLTLAVACVTLGLLLAHIYAGGHRTTRQKNTAQTPPANMVPSPATAGQGGAVKQHFYDKDKEYFIKVWQNTKEKWKQTAVVIVFAAGLFTLLFLKWFTTLLSNWLYSVISAVFILAIYFIWQRINKETNKRKPEDKKVNTHDFNPVSYGVLYFGFALSLWATIKTDTLTTFIAPVLVCLVSAVFFVAVFSRPLRKWLNTKAAPVVLQLTFWVLLLGFFYDWIPAYLEKTGITLQVIFYFGFLWLVIILLTIYRDVKWELLRLLFVIGFLAEAIRRIFDFTPIGYIGGATLFVIAGLMYFVATGHLKLYGKLED